MYTEQLNRIDQLKLQLEPIQNRLNVNSQTTKVSLDKINQTISEYIKSNTSYLDVDTKVSFDINERYGRLIVDNKSDGGWSSSEISIELIGFDSFSLWSRDRKDFDPTETTYSFSGSSSKSGLDNIQGMDTQIIKGFLSIELKKFGIDRNGDNIFTELNTYYIEYFNLLSEKFSIQSETYPLTSEIESIEKEIKKDKKERADKIILDEIEKNVGNVFESIEKYEYPYNNSNNNSIGNVFGLKRQVKKITILKSTKKSFTVQFGYWIGDKKRIKKSEMVDNFKYLKRWYTEEEKKLMNRSNIIKKVLNQ